MQRHHRKTESACCEIVQLSSEDAECLQTVKVWACRIFLMHCMVPADSSTGQTQSQSVILPVVITSVSKLWNILCWIGVKGAYSIFSVLHWLLFRPSVPHNLPNLPCSECIKQIDKLCDLSCRVVALEQAVESLRTTQQQVILSTRNHSNSSISVPSLPPPPPPPLPPPVEPLGNHTLRFTKSGVIKKKTTGPPKISITVNDILSVKLKKREDKGEQLSPAPSPTSECPWAKAMEAIKSHRRSKSNDKSLLDSPRNDVSGQVKSETDLTTNSLMKLETQPNISKPEEIVILAESDIIQCPAPASL